MSYKYYDCKRLTNINIPSSVVSIKKGAFWGTAIVNNSPDGVVYLDNWAIWHKGPMPSSITFKEGTVGIAGEIFEQEHTLDYANLNKSLCRTP